MPSWQISDSSVYQGEGTLSNLQEILGESNNVLLFGDSQGYHVCGAAEYVAQLKDKNKGLHLHEILYSGKALPLKDIENIYLEVKKLNPIDAIVALGGGTVMDLAKIIAIANTNQCRKVEEALEDKSLENTIPLVFVPTTAGTGSEATSFAVVYRDKTKMSIERKSIVGDYVILDPLLLTSLPVAVLNATLLDALAQATESIWARGGTEESRQFASRAIPPILANIDKENSLDRLSKLQVGSYWAGKAINISKTTLCHSISYPLTSHFGIPHGIAVFLTIAEVALMNYNSLRQRKGNDDESRLLENNFNQIFTLYRVENITQLVSRLKEIMALLKIEPRLSGHGIKSKDLPFIASRAITPGRSDNNPVDISQEGLLKLLKGIL